jgi:hypothetical protein
VVVTVVAAADIILRWLEWNSDRGESMLRKGERGGGGDDDSVAKAAVREINAAAAIKTPGAGGLLRVNEAAEGNKS